MRNFWREILSGSRELMANFDQKFFPDARMESIARPLQKRRRVLFPELSQHEAHLKPEIGIHVGNAASLNPASHANRIEQPAPCAYSLPIKAHDPMQETGVPGQPAWCGSVVRPGSSCQQTAPTLVGQPSAAQTMPAYSYDGMAAHAGAPYMPGSSNVLECPIPLPTALTQLTNMQELAAPDHAKCLIAGLPSYPIPEVHTSITQQQLAEALGFVEIPAENVDHQWPPLNEECLDEPCDKQEADLLISAATARVEAAASRLESKESENIMRQRRFEWSFQAYLPKFCPAVLEALREKEEQEAPATHV